MGVASLSPRSSSGGLGLGWLLAFSLGGAVLLFTCVGLLLSWRIKSRPENNLPTTTTVYQVTDRDGSTVGVGAGSGGGGGGGGGRSRLKKRGGGLGFGRRLTRRKYVMARSTSRLSLSPSSLLPPMPTYQGFSFFGQGGRKKSRSWVEEDKFHGPRMNRRSLRNSWFFNRDSWRGKTPTLPAVVFDEPDDDVDEEDVEKGTGRGGGGSGGGRGSPEAGLTGLHIPRTASPEEMMGVSVLATTALPPPPPPPMPAPLQVQQQHQPQPQPHPEPQQYQQSQSQQYQQSQSQQYEQQQPLPYQPQQPQPYQQMTEMEPIFITEELPLTETTAARPPRIPAQLLTRLALADSDLNDILRSTEQRLKEGRHRSPDKTTTTTTTTTTTATTTPTTSPTKASPIKTPHSHKTASSQGSIGSVGTVRIARLSTSPSKRATICTIPQSTQHSRNASISSMGSTAAAAAAAAAQGTGSETATPSNPRGRAVAWQLPKPDMEPVIDLSAALHIRSQSLESDESSTLSTVYSVGEQDDKTAEARGGGSAKDAKKNPYDPFVGPPAAATAGLPAKSRLFGPRSPRKLSISGPAPVGLPSLRPTAGGRPQTVGGHAMFSIVLDPPTDNNLFEMDYFNAIGKDGIALAYPISPSMGSPSLSEPSVTSMVTASVTTARDSDGDSDTIGASEEERLTRDKLETQTSPTKRNSVVTIYRASPVKTAASSAHYDRRDLISLVRSNSPLQRALPEPPRHFGHIDESTMPAPISPRPRRDFSQQLRELSVNSNLHDEEPTPEDPSAVSTGSPHRRPNLRNARSPPLSAVMAVGSSVAELRRMNSMVSTCSVASVTSSTCNDESPTVPGLRGAGFSPTRSSARASNIGQHHYLSLGTPSKRESGPGRSLPSNARISRVDPGGDDSGEGNGYRREMDGVDFRVRRVDASLPVGPRSSDDAGLGTALRVTSHRDSMDGLEVIEPSGLDRRIIRDSLGMYDKKGFVRSSVRREMMRR